MFPDELHSLSDQGVLFGILALQANYIDRDTFVDAIRVWAIDRSKPLAHVLSEHGKLPVQRQVMLEALVEEQLAADADKRHVPPGTPTSVLLPPSRDHIRSSESSPTSQDNSLGFSKTASSKNGHSPTFESVNRSSGVDRYRVLRPHAKGGLGEIFVAQDQELDREVALKEIQVDHAHHPYFRGRFVREAKITGGLEHPGIVAIYSLGTHADGRPFYAMRFVNGVNLKEAIDRFHEADGPNRNRSQRGLEFRQLLRRFVDMCNAVAYAHSRGVLHRDLKPGNVMLGSFGETLIVDWGLAKAVGDVENSELRIQKSESVSDTEVINTQPGAAVGTPAYMSPEQAAGRVEHLGPAADIYGLGATLYTVLTGRPPFSSGDRGELLRAVQRGEFPRPRQVKKDVPAALDAICVKAMARQPAERYASALELADDVEHWLADEPVSTYREPWRERTRRFLRKHRTLATSAAATILVAMFLSSGAAILLNMARAGEREARIDEAKQAVAAKEAAQQAKKASEHAEAATDFLVEALRSPDPSLDGREIKVVELLDRAVKKVDEKFSDDTAMRSRLLAALGKTYAGLGLPGRAAEILKRALELQQAIHGRTHADTVQVMKDLRDAYRADGKYAEETQLAEEIVKLETAKFGPDHPWTVTAMLTLAYAYTQIGRERDALLLLEAITASPKIDRGDFKQMNNVALAYSRCGQHELARELLAESHRLQKSSQGLDHPDSLTTASNLALVYEKLGHPVNAIALFEETLKGRKTQLGPDHPDTLLSTRLLANAYLRGDRAAEALPLLESALQIAMKKFGPDHAHTLTAMASLAVALQKSRRPSDAIRTLEEAIKLGKARYGRHHSGTLTHMTNLASFYRDAGRLQDAIALLEDILDSGRDVVSEKPNRAAALMCLGDCLNRQDRFAEAEVSLREALNILDKKHSHHWSHATAQIVLGQALVGQRKYAEAESHLISGYEAVQIKGKSNPVEMSHAKARVFHSLIQLYQATDRPGEVERWRAKRAEAKLPLPGKDPEEAKR